jgi:ribosomal protein S18 acetylase RimI-like enzyme
VTPRLARADEAAAVAALVERAYAPWVAVIGRRPMPMDDDYTHHIAVGEVWVLADGAGMAAISVLVEAADHLLLDNVAVDPARRGEGLGRAMIAHAEAEARARGLGELRLFTNVLMERNIRLYERLGFVETHRATEVGFSRVFMSKRL